MFMMPESSQNPRKQAPHQRVERLAFLMCEFALYLYELCNSSKNGRLGAYFLSLLFFYNMDPLNE